MCRAMPMPLSPAIRLFAALVAATAFGSLVLQFIQDWRELGEAANAPLVLWRMARYFTVLTNAIVVGVLGYTALAGRWPGPGWPAALTVWIVVVGAVYYALLAATHDPQGLEVYSNVGFHAIVPAGTAVLWWAAAPRQGLTLAGPVIWTAYPLGYAVYALLRGLWDGTFPYFFLNPEKTGALGVGLYILGLGAVFLGLGCALVGLARLGSRARERALP